LAFDPLTMNHFPLSAPCGTFLGRRPDQKDGAFRRCAVFPDSGRPPDHPGLYSANPTGRRSRSFRASPRRIEAHNDAGEISFYIITALGVAPWRGSSPFGKRALIRDGFETGSGPDVVAAVGGLDAWLGGKIHHQEIHEGLPPARRPPCRRIGL